MKPDELHFRELIEYVCFPCGHKYAGVVIPTNSICTVHQGRCDICEETKAVADKRNFNYVRAITFKEWINAKQNKVSNET